MPSQLELAKETLKRFEAQGVSEDNAMVKGLRAQIAMHEKPRSENPMSNFSGGMRSAPRSSAPPTKAKTLPAAPSREDFPNEEQFEEARAGWQSRVGRIKGMAGVKVKA